MGIFDKIMGKDEEAAETPKKPEKVKAEKKKEPAKEKKKPAPKTESAKSRKEASGRKVSKKEDNIAHGIILESIISEKSTGMGADNKYVFKVSQKAGKFQIKEAIEGYYGVEVIKVNTIRISPKKRIHGRTIGYKQGFKKAVVTLRQGDTITAVEGV